MANSDYVIRGSLQLLVSHGLLAADITEATQGAALTGFKVAGEAPAAGSLMMIGTEFCRLISKSGNYMDFRRGCGDTIPKPWPAGTVVWFLGGDRAGSDDAEYGGTQEVAVKVLPRTSSGQRVPIGGVAPQDIQFVQRFDRPYPPGRVEVDGDPWYLAAAEIDELTDCIISWAHRNRVTQHDVLVSHDAASVTPEAGTTYRLRMFDSADTLLATRSLGLVDTFTYTEAMGSADMGTTDVIEGYFLLDAMRDGLGSYQSYQFPFLFTPSGYVPEPYGLGYRLGESLGGVEL